MSFLGLGMKIVDHRSQKPNQQCERCGLLYPKDEEKCTHCRNLDEGQLHTLKESILNSEESTNSLGKIFLIMTLVVIFIFAISFMT